MTHSNRERTVFDLIHIKFIIIRGVRTAQFCPRVWSYVPPAPPCVEPHPCYGWILRTIPAWASDASPESTVIKLDGIDDISNRLTRNYGSVMS